MFQKKNLHSTDVVTIENVLHEKSKTKSYLQNSVVVNVEIRVLKF